MTAIKRVLLLVLDSCGCGGDPDAARWGDAGANTLVHTAEAVGGLELPALHSLGLGNVTGGAMPGVPAAERPEAAFGRMQERSEGKDTTTGHWEIAGLLTERPFQVFADGFPRELLDAFSAATGRPVVGNRPASGTAIIEELGPQQLETGAWIVYTSGDSVFQIAAHKDVIPLEELYAACTIARDLCDPLRVARVIARPYVGDPGAFERTYERHDYGMPPHGETVLDRLREAGLPVHGVGKISDIFSGRGLTDSVTTRGNLDGLERSADLLTRVERGLIFVNLIDFDMLWGHRRNPGGFAASLVEFDRFLPRLRALLGPGDLMLITADHGNDPTHAGTDHTREQVPLIALGPGGAGTDLGVRQGFFDIAATIADALGVPQGDHGASFLRHVAPADEAPPGEVDP